MYNITTTQSKRIIRLFKQGYDRNQIAKKENLNLYFIDKIIDNWAIKSFEEFNKKINTNLINKYGYSKTEQPVKWNILHIINTLNKNPNKKSIRVETKYYAIKIAKAERLYKNTSYKYSIQCNDLNVLFGEFEKVSEIIKTLQSISNEYPELRRLYLNLKVDNTKIYFDLTKNYGSM
jgi:hypothetical protein